MFLMDNKSEISFSSDFDLSSMGKMPLLQDVCPCARGQPGAQACGEQLRAGSSCLLNPVTAGSSGPGEGVGSEKSF